MVKNILVWWVYFLCLWVPNQDVGKVHLSRVELSEMFGLSGHSYTDRNPHLLQTSPCEVLWSYLSAKSTRWSRWLLMRRWPLEDLPSWLEAAFDASPLGDVGASAIPALLAYSTPTSTGALLLMWQIRKTALVPKSLHILPFAHNNIIHPNLGLQEDASENVACLQITIQWENYDKPLIFGHPIF
jgi:hypothetical protein